MIEDGAATGVVYTDKSGAIVTARAEREVMLCVGAAASPRILLRSGIGDADQLTALGIAPLHHLGGGSARPPVRLRPAAAEERGADAQPAVAQPPAARGGDAALRPLPHRGSAAASCEVCGFLDSREQGSRPDIEITFRPLSFDLLPDGGWRPPPYPGGTSSVCATRPRSRGRVTLVNDGNGARRVAIHPNYLAHDEDVMRLVRGLRILRRIPRTEPIASCVVSEKKPGPEVESDNALAQYVRETASTVYQPGRRSAPAR